ncbi:MAG: hypothetical protein ACYC5K_13395, partial [Saccharofermentanales bacterium]
LGLQAKVTDYETYRPIFRKYTPSVKLLDAAGWEPVTYAESTNKNISIERFGSLEQKNLALTAYNNDSSATEAVIDINLQALKCTNEQFNDLAVFDMISREYLPILKSESRNAVSVIVPLASGQASNMLVGTRSDIFNLLKTYIDAEISRSKTAYPDIASKIGTLPSGWFDLTGKISAAFSACGNKTLEQYISDVLPKIKNVYTSAENLREKITGTYKPYFDSDIYFAGQDGFLMLDGLAKESDMPASSSSQQSSLNNSSTSSISSSTDSNASSSTSYNDGSSSSTLPDSEVSSKTAEVEPLSSSDETIGIDYQNNIIYFSKPITVSEFLKSVLVQEGYSLKVYDETFNELSSDSQITDSCIVKLFQGENEISLYTVINSKIPDGITSLSNGDADNNGSIIVIIIVVAITLLILEMMIIYALKIRKAHKN